MKKQQIHIVPVVHDDTGDLGHLLRLKRTPRRIKLALEAVRTVSKEPGGWFIPEAEINAVAAILNAGEEFSGLCESCLFQKVPCGAWPQEYFDREAFTVGDVPKIDRAARSIRALMDDFFGVNLDNVWADCEALLGQFFGQKAPRVEWAKVDSGMPRSEAARLLGVSVDCSRSELDRAFREAAMRSHPDVGGTDEQMRRVLEARKVMVG